MDQLFVRIGGGTSVAVVNVDTGLDPSTLPANGREAWSNHRRAYPRLVVE
jgi:hypothetical protein